MNQRWLIYTVCNYHFNYSTWKPKNVNIDLSGQEVMFELIKEMYRYQSAIYHWSSELLKCQHSFCDLTKLKIWLYEMQEITGHVKTNTYLNTVLCHQNSLTLANCRLAAAAYLAWRSRWFEWISTQYFKWSLKIRVASNHASFDLMALVIKEARFYRKPVNTRIIFRLKSICSPVTFQIHLPENFYRHLLTTHSATGSSEIHERTILTPSRDQCKCPWC